MDMLHLYQPPTQSPAVVEKIANESYALILELLRTYPRAKFTINISGSLIEHLVAVGRVDIVEGLRAYAAEGRVELVGSAMYHPILPLLPMEEVRRQIELNEEILQKYFGTTYARKGFFIPEMAYSLEVAECIEEFGFKWIVLDEMHATVKPRSDVRHRISGTKQLIAVFRDRGLSKTFVPQVIIPRFDSLETYSVTAHDGELYGHWHKGGEKWYAAAFEHEGLTMLTISEYLDQLSEEDVVETQRASWETRDGELPAVPYWLWDNPENEVHAKLWELLAAARGVVTAHPEDVNAYYARHHLDRGSASCAFWWASSTIPAAFSHKTWNPEEIEKGAFEMVKSVRSVESASPAEKSAIEALYADLLRLVWQIHWNRTA